MPCAGDEEIACGEKWWPFVFLYVRKVYRAASERAALLLRLSSVAHFRVLPLLLAWWELDGSRSAMYRMSFSVFLVPKDVSCVLNLLVAHGKTIAMIYML